MSTKVRNRRRRRPQIQTLEARHLLAATNPIEPLDVSGDLSVTPLDALQVINAVRRGEASAKDFPDVNADGTVAPVDALRIINAIRRGDGGPADIGRSPLGSELAFAETEFVTDRANANGLAVSAVTLGDTTTIDIHGENLIVTIDAVDDDRIEIDATSNDDDATDQTINGRSGPVVISVARDLRLRSFGEDVRVELDGVQIEDDLSIEFFGRFNQLSVVDTAVGDDVFAQLGRGVGDNALQFGSTRIGDDLLVDLGLIGGDVTVEASIVGDDLRIRGGIIDDTIRVTRSSIGDELDIEADRGDDSISIDDVNVFDTAILQLSQGDDRLAIRDGVFTQGVRVETDEGRDRTEVRQTRIAGSFAADLGGSGDSLLFFQSGTGDDLSILTDRGDNRITIESASIANDLRIFGNASDVLVGLHETRVTDDLRIEGGGNGTTLALTDSVRVDGETRIDDVEIVDITDRLVPVAFDVIASSGSGTPNGLTIAAPSIVAGDAIGNVRRFDGVTGEELDPFAVEFENDLLDPRDLVLTGDLSDSATTLFINTADFNNPSAPPTDGLIDQDGTLEFALDGTFLRVVTDFRDSFGEPVSPGGGVFAPTIDPDDDPAARSFFIGSRVQGDILEIDPSDGTILGSVAGTEDIAFPRGFVFGEDGSLFLGSGANPATGAGDDSILRIDPVSGQSEVFFNAELGGIDFSPLDVILSADGNSLITSSESPFSPGVVTPSQVLIIPLNFDSPDDIIVLDPGVGADGQPILVDPRGLGIGPDGLLYASSAGNDQILRFNAQTGEFIDVFASEPGINAQAVTFVPAGPSASILEQTLGAFAVR